MTGEPKQQEHRTRGQRNASRSVGKDDASHNPPPRNRGRRSGGGRKGSYQFTDQMEHIICQRMTHLAPESFPVLDRSDLATITPFEVARTESSILLCDGLHEGRHIWPNGDEVL